MILDCRRLVGTSTTEEATMLQETAARRYVIPTRRQARETAPRHRFSPEILATDGAKTGPGPRFRSRKELVGFGGTVLKNIAIMRNWPWYLPEPTWSQSFSLGGLITQLGSDAQKEELLAGYCSRLSCKLAVALDEPNRHYQSGRSAKRLPSSQGDSLGS